MSEALHPNRARRWWLRRPVLAGLAAAGILAGFVLVWFQPQQLFIDNRVEEAAPGAAAPRAGGPSGVDSTDTSAPHAGSSAPTELARGMFVSLDHTTSGTARVLEIGDEARVVRLEGFETENGPDLYVYLTTARSDGEEAAFDDEFVNLGRLKGNQGDQNYELTADVDISRFQTVVIWCDRFNSPFGAADLAAA